MCTGLRLAREGDAIRAGPGPLLKGIRPCDRCLRGRCVSRKAETAQDSVPGIRVKSTAWEQIDRFWQLSAGGSERDHGLPFREAPGQETGLLIACAKGRPEVAEVLIEAGGADLVLRAEKDGGPRASASRAKTGIDLARGL